MAAVASETYTSVSAPIQHAAVHAFHGDVRIERYLWHARRILAALGGQCAEILIQAGLRVHRPVGAFYLYADFSPLRRPLASRGITDGRSLTTRLLEETGVAILPAVCFARAPEELAARLAYVDFDGAQALAASENVPLHEPLAPDFTQTRCERVLVGVQRIAEWATARN